MTFVWFVVTFPILFVTAEKMYIGASGANTTMADVRICRSVKIDDNFTYHITRYEPVAGSNIHHIILASCAESTFDDQDWSCGVIDEPGYPTGGACKYSEAYWLYGWPKRASKAGLLVPDGVSFQVGKDTGYKYFTLEVHYALPTVSRNVDESKAGVYITYSNKPITNAVAGLANIAPYAPYFSVPAKKKTTIDNITRVPVSMRPLMFHVHIHGLGTKVSAYLIKRNPRNPDKPTWTLIGLQSPPFPQDNFPVTNNMTMEPGDLIGMRCTYYNYRDHDVNSGPGDFDEMCEYGILYAVHRGSYFPNRLSTQIGDWKEMGLTNIPPEA